MLRKVNKQKKIDLVVFGGDLIDRGGESFSSPTEGFKTFEEIVLLPIKSELGLTNEHIVIGKHSIVSEAYCMNQVTLHCKT